MDDPAQLHRSLGPDRYDPPGGVMVRFYSRSCETGVVVVGIEARTRRARWGCAREM